MFWKYSVLPCMLELFLLIFETLVAVSVCSDPTALLHAWEAVIKYFMVTGLGCYFLLQFHVQLLAHALGWIKCLVMVLDVGSHLSVHTSCSAGDLSFILLMLILWRRSSVYFGFWSVVSSARCPPLHPIQGNCPWDYYKPLFGCSALSGSIYRCLG